MIGVERIDLLPGFVAARKRARRLLQGSTLIASAAAAACAVTFLSQGFAIRDARSELDVQLAENAAVAVEVSRLADLEAMSARLDATQAALMDLTAKEVRWSIVLGDIQAIMPTQTWLTGMTMSMAGEDSSSVAELSFQATTLHHNRVVDWLQRLDRIPGISNAYFSVSSKEAAGSRTLVTFAATASVTQEALRRSTPGARR